MGYHNRIAILSKEKHQIIQNMTHGELVKWFKGVKKVDPDDSYVPCYELSEEVYGMGKGCDLKYLKPFMKPVFSKVRTHNRYNDEGEFVIIGKEGLAAIIDDYRVAIRDYLKEILNPDPLDVERGRATTPEHYVRRIFQEWDDNNFGIKPYCMRQDTETVVTSWKFEYTIFELVRLYKTIDTEKYEICLTGW